MNYEMNLLTRPFDQIKMGVKIYEIRCNDAKRQLLKVGDTITFKKLPDLTDTIEVTIVSLHPYPSFAELFQIAEPIDFGGVGLSREELVKSMYTIYPPEREKAEGVLGIKIRYDGEKTPYKRVNSYGGIIFKRDPELKVLLILHLNGNHWSFPKGHQENGEKPLATATREIKEETNLDVALKKDAYFSTMYFESATSLKTVTYFVAMPLSLDVKMQANEIGDIGWFTISEAFAKLHFDNDKAILQAAISAYENG